jgi:hypothetical protein
MKRTSLVAIVAGGVSLAVLGGIALAAQDRYMLRAPDGLSFGEFRGYETWQDVAVSFNKSEVKVILANTPMISAYRSGLPAKGKVFPEGSKAVKISWAPKPNTVSPYPIMVPAALENVAFIEKDSKRFPKTHGWAFAEFAYDPATGAFKPADPTAPGRPVTGHECGYACHTTVAAQDYIFTAYPKR